MRGMWAGTATIRSMDRRLRGRSEPIVARSDRAAFRCDTRSAMRRGGGRSREDPGVRARKDQAGLDLPQLRLEPRPKRLMKSHRLRDTCPDTFSAATPPARRPFEVPSCAADDKHGFRRVRVQSFRPHGMIVRLNASLSVMRVGMFDQEPVGFVGPFGRDVTDRIVSVSRFLQCGSWNSSITEATTMVQPRRWTRSISRKPTFRRTSPRHWCLTRFRRRQRPGPDHHQCRRNGSRSAT